jgi:endogenous inhibitor of DNA gyrase (YacG/DUF329 family)
MQCPICRKPVDKSDLDKPQSTFPFCSERCKLIDLGRWLGGKYQIVTKIEEDDDGAAPSTPSLDDRD